jgi:hypothetical protein
MTTHFRPTEMAIYSLLSDGRLHKREELMECLRDPMATRKTLNVWLCYLRKKIGPDLLIDCVTQGRGGVYYRLSRRFISDGD